MPETPPSSEIIRENQKIRPQKGWQSLHPIERPAKLHVIFVWVHPFIDGNGRTSRLLLNLDLMKVGFPPIVIKTENRLAYYDSLDKAHTTGEYGDFIELVKGEVNHTLDLYLSLVQ